MKDAAHTHHHGRGVLIVAGLTVVAVCTGTATAFVGALASLLVTLVITLGAAVILAIALALLVVPRIVR